MIRATDETTNFRIWMLTNVNRIGHVFLEPYCFINLFDATPENARVFVPGDRSVCNRAALEFVRRYIPVEKCPDSRLFSAVATGHAPVQVGHAGQKARVLKWSNELWLEYARRYHTGKQRAKRYAFNAEDRCRGEQLLRDLDIPEGAPFVALHNREAGYLPKHTYHSYRDAHVENFLPAIRYLTKRGYWVVRIGDDSMTRLPSMAGVVDLPFHPGRTEFADIWFSASCRFFIGNSSGPMIIPYTFGVPRLLLNMMTHGPVCYGHPLDLYVPKRLYSRRQMRDLSFREAAPVESFRSEEYESKGVEVVENSPSEILSAVQEMLDRVEGAQAPDSTMTSLQNRYRRIVREVQEDRQRHGDYNIRFYEPTEISYRFLQMHPHLLV